MSLDKQVCAETGFLTRGQVVFWGSIGVLAVSLCLLSPRPTGTILAAQRGTPRPPDLRYRFQEGRTYVYEVNITADFGDVKETRGGVSIYEVKSATPEQITLTHSGSLSARRSRRDGQSVIPFPSIRNPFFWSSSVTAREGELTIDARGEIVRSQHLTSLPYMLGDFQVLTIEPLPETPNTSWEKKREVTVTEKEQSRFPPMAFGPFSEQPRGVNRSASETVSYSIIGSDGQVTRIKRTYALRTDDQVGGKPRLGMTGVGEQSFDVQQGVMKSELTKYTVEVNEEGESATIPVTVDYRLLGPEEAAKRLEELEEKKAAMPGAHLVDKVSVPTTDSALGAGSEGAAFRFLDPEARPVIGLRYQLGSWAGQRVIGHLEPLYTRDAVPQPWQAVFAREGYALGAIQVDGTRYVNAVRAAFMKLEGDGLNTKDRHLTQWIGTPTGGKPKSIFSTGARVLGLHGKRGAVVDGVGLVFEVK